MASFNWLKNDLSRYVCGRCGILVSALDSRLSSGWVLGETRNSHSVFQVYEWVFDDGSGGWGGGGGNLSVEVEIVLVASCYRSQEKLRLYGPDDQTVFLHVCLVRSRGGGEGYGTWQRKYRTVVRT